MEALRYNSYGGSRANRHNIQNIPSVEMSQSYVFDNDRNPTVDYVNIHTGIFDVFLKCF